MLVDHLVWDGSLDAKMVQMLLQKQEVADRALDRPTEVAKEILFVPAEPPAEPVPALRRLVLREAIRHLVVLSAKHEGGFGRFDVEMGNRLAIGDRPWSDRQAHVADKLVHKYRRQIPPKILSDLGIVLSPRDLAELRGEKKRGRGLDGKRGDA